MKMVCNPINCVCGSDRMLRCSDKTIRPNKYWLECLDCGHIGGIVYSNQVFTMKTVSENGTEMIHCPENDSINKWNEEIENNKEIKE